MGTPLVRAAFAALLFATLAAFFIAQQLKGEFPLVIRFSATPAAISPNGDGVGDQTIVGFDLSRKAKVTFSILDSEGAEVKRFVDNRLLEGDQRYRYTWNGRDSSGSRVPDGNYRMRVIRRDEGRVINSLKHITVDTRPPRVRLVSARPGVISTGPGDHPRVRIRYRGPRNKHPEFRIFRTDGGRTRIVLRFRGDDTKSAVWNGRIHGHPAPDGDYAFTVKARDRAANATVAPQDVPTPDSARAGTGVSVRHLTLTGPSGVVRAGTLAVLQVGPRERRFRFAVSGLGGRRTLRQGRRRGGRLRVRIPPRAPTGIYVVRVRAAGHRAVWPLAVSGRSRGHRPRPLVVLPMATWQGRNRVDDDLDGFADTLEGSHSVSLGRPFAGGRLPTGLRREAAPLLRFLERARLPYDLTTDVSLAQGRGGAALRRASGVAFAGSEEWLPEPLVRILGGYVRGGGRLASFGAGSFHRSVGIGRDRLQDPTPARRPNFLGERTSVVRGERAPLSVEQDRARLFPDQLVGDFSVFERSDGLEAGGRLLSAAGRQTGERDFVAYRLGRGLVVRTGTPQWGRQLAAGAAVPAVTRRIWRLIGGS
jgi:N,N-dimethylformamidase beta subunit-like protein/flagellar hook capping protein FlgD